MKLLITDFISEESERLFVELSVEGDVQQLSLAFDPFISEKVMSPYRVLTTSLEPIVASPFLNFSDGLELKQVNQLLADILLDDRKIGFVEYLTPMQEVKTVSWLDERQMVRLVEHYDALGVCVAETIFEKGQALRRNFYRGTRLVLSHNLVQGGLVQYEEQGTITYVSLADFLSKFIVMLEEVQGGVYEELIVNRMGDAWLATNFLDKPVHLVVQESFEAFPHNLRFILEGQSRVVRVTFENKADLIWLKDQGIESSLTID